MQFLNIGQQAAQQYGLWEKENKQKWALYYTNFIPGDLFQVIK